MFKNYLKTTLRNLWKHRGYSFLNITGLAVGIACAALIFLWVGDELTFNHQFAKRDRLYRIMENQTYDGVISTFQATPGPMADAVRAEIPGVANSTRMTWPERSLFALGEKVIYEQGCYVDSTFFSMFTLPFVYGDPRKAFAQVHSLVLTQTMARRFFGDVDPVGKTLKMNNEQDYLITGVIRDLEPNTSFRFDWLAPVSLHVEKNQWLKNWDSNGIATFVELEPNARVSDVNKRLYGFLATKQAEIETKCFLFSMNDWRLYHHFTHGKQDGGGRIEYVRLFTIIAWVILLIACINFMNLSTARSEQRSREVGVRKVLGAQQKMLISQFMGESLLMSFLAVLVAIAIIYLTLPAFNTLVEKELSFRILDPLHAGGLLAIGLISGLVAGSYPALYLSSFNPITVLKGLKVQTKAGAVFIRKGLVVLQFTISTVLIIGTVIIYQQVQHVKDRQMGYNQENLIFMELRGDLGERFSVVKNDLIATGVVQNTALSNSNVLEFNSNGGGMSWPGKDPNKEILITMEGVSPEYIPTMGMQLKAGRNFYDNAAADSNNIIINESLAKLIAKDGVVGGLITSGGGGKYRIVGVVKDFVYNDMYSKPIPVIFFCNPKSTNHLSIRFKPGVNLSGALAKVEAVMKTHNPGYPFEYKFVDEEFGRMFKNEMLIGKLATVFAALAIFISCLGLFGLAAFTAGQRTKEIGIRKVLGASVGSIVGLLSNDFLRLVLWSNLIAWPVAWWAMNHWLDDYEYRISIPWWIFGAAGLVTLLIALGTVSYQSIRAARANPIRSLRTE